MTWAKPGDDIRKHINARTVNKLLNKKSRKGRSLDLPLNVSEHVILNGWAATGVSIAEFDPVRISGPVLTERPEYRDVLVNVPENPPGETHWAVAQGTIVEKYSSPVVLKGMTWANVEIIDEAHKFVDFFDDGLKTTDNGPARLIFPGEMTTPEDEEEEPVQLPSFIQLNGLTPDCCCLGEIVEIDITDPLNIHGEVEVILAPSDRADLVGRTITVYDKACIFDEPPEDMVGVKVWFSWYIHPVLNKGSFFANNRCCI